jgi:hypothetical protein
MAIGKSARKEYPLEAATVSSGKTLLPNGSILDEKGNVISGPTGAGTFGGPQIDPNVGIGVGSLGGPDISGLQAQQQQIQAETNALVEKWKASNPQSGGGMLGGLGAEMNAMNALRSDPAYQALMDRQRVVSRDLQALDMSDPGRFAAMANGAQGREGVTLTRFGEKRTASPDVYEMQRQNAPRTYDPGEAAKAQMFNAREFGVDKTQIDSTAGDMDYAAYQQARAKNLEVMGAVQDRAMGRGGPSPAELQMKQGQDRAISQQAALAASGGQMDAAMARRQAMLGAASIGQKTASDTSLLRANEQIAAQNTFGGMNSAQQTSDLGARNQSFGQAQARATNDWQQNLGAAQFGSDQSFRNAQLGASQSQFNAGQANQYQLGRAQTMAQQGQFGAQFGLSQEQAIAQSMSQQRQFNSQFQNQQNQWGQQFGAQQELNQGQLTMQQRGMNDQYQNAMLGQYMNSRGMQQQNAWHNQTADLQMAGLKQGMNIANMQDAQVRDAAARQQQTAMLGGVATGVAGYMAANKGGGAAAGGGAPATGSGFNQSDPSKIDWGY